MTKNELAELAAAHAAGTKADPKYPYAGLDLATQIENLIGNAKNQHAQIEAVKGARVRDAERLSTATGISALPPQNEVWGQSVDAVFVDKVVAYIESLQETIRNLHHPDCTVNKHMPPDMIGKQRTCRGECHLTNVAAPVPACLTHELTPGMIHVTEYGGRCYLEYTRGEPCGVCGAIQCECDR